MLVPSRSFVHHQNQLPATHQTSCKILKSAAWQHIKPCSCLQHLKTSCLATHQTSCLATHQNQLLLYNTSKPAATHQYQLSAKHSTWNFPRWGESKLICPGKGNQKPRKKKHLSRSQWYGTSNLVSHTTVKSVTCTVQAHTIRFSVLV